MKYIIYVSFICINLSAVAQFIEVPAGTPLTVQGNLNLSTGFSIQYNGQNFIKSPVSGSFNTYLGVEAGATGSGSQNTFLGYQTGRANTSGTYNTFIGYLSGFNNSTGTYNVFIGQQAGLNTTTGGSNLFLGSFAGENNTGGSFNLFMGNSSGRNTTSGNGNTFVGDGAGYGNTTGIQNTYMGQYAGFNANGGGSNNVFIGYGSGVNTNPTGINNAVALGANAVVNQSNSIILGSPNVNVAIGNSAPQNKLEITKGVSNQSGLRFTNLTSSSPASLLNQTKFLTVNANGDVVLGSLNNSARMEAGKWTTDGEHLQNTNEGGVFIGQVPNIAPIGYKLFVEDGILTEKLKVAIKNTSAWSDKVFDSHYSLKSLREVDSYIKSYKHLPGVPSASDMVKQGLDVAQMDAKLLEKIEELTLYSIELEKNNYKQQKQIKQLAKQSQLDKQHLNAELNELKRQINSYLKKSK